jgi:hypothetical protein
MSKPKAKRNSDITSAVCNGVPYKEVASKYGISIARVSQITQAVVAKPAPIVSKDEVASALDRVAEAINNLADAVRHHKET